MQLTKVKKIAKYPPPCKFIPEHPTTFVDQHFRVLDSAEVIAPLRAPFQVNFYQLEVILAAIRALPGDDPIIHVNFVGWGETWQETDAEFDKHPLPQMVLQVGKRQALRTAGGRARKGEDPKGPGLEGWLHLALNPHLRDGTGKRERPIEGKAEPAQRLLDGVKDHVHGDYLTQEAGVVHRVDVIRLTVELQEMIEKLQLKK